jgi:hypothetical protein
VKAAQGDPPGTAGAAGAGPGPAPFSRFRLFQDHYPERTVLAHRAIIISTVLPSGRWFLNRDVIYADNRRGRQRARWLCEAVCAYADSAAEFGGDPAKPSGKSRRPGPFPSLLGKDPEKDDATLEEQQGVVADAAEGCPRLPTWLAEGQVDGFWNAFGARAGCLRLSSYSPSAGRPAVRPGQRERTRMRS